MAFRIGQKVVCVDNSADVGRSWHPGERPIIDEIYTVERIGYSHGLLCAQLAELPRTCPEHKWFRQTRFRPAVERKTDISIFTKMLTSETTKSLVKIQRIIERVNDR